MVEPKMGKEKEKEELPENLTKGKLVDAVKKTVPTESAICVENDMNNRDEIIFLYQYVLDSKTGIIRNELYEYLIMRTIYDHAKENSLTKEDLIKNIENDYNLTNVPDVHITSALERLQTKQVSLWYNSCKMTLLPL